MKKIAITVVGWGVLVAGGAFAAWDINPSFEDPYTDGWYSFSPASTSNSVDFALDGSQALEVETDQIGRYTVIDFPYSSPVPGAKYTLSVSYYLPEFLVPAENLGIGIRWRKIIDVNGTNTWAYSSINPGGLNGGLGPVGTETTGAWERVTHSDTAPADAEYMEIQLEVTGAGSLFYFDDVSISVFFPPLALERSGDDLVVDFAGGGVLQSATNLVPEAWTDVEGGTVTNGPYLIPLPQPDEFFRLREP